jgi:hypothetical protein
VLTGHWIEETSPGVWQFQEAILGFTRLNNAHHGVRLGQALFKLVTRIGIQRRVSLCAQFITPTLTLVPRLGMPRAMAQPTMAQCLLSSPASSKSKPVSSGIQSSGALGLLHELFFTLLLNFILQLSRTRNQHRNTKTHLSLQRISPFQCARSSGTYP